VAVREREPSQPIDDGLQFESGKFRISFDKLVARAQIVVDSSAIDRRKKTVVEVDTMAKMAADAALETSRRGLRIKRTEARCQLDALFQNCDVVGY
jgi:hypothetical protein